MQIDSRRMRSQPGVHRGTWKRVQRRVPGARSTTNNALSGACLAVLLARGCLAPHGKGVGRIRLRGAHLDRRDQRLERTCRLKSILGKSASPYATHFGPKHRLRGHSRGARWENQAQKRVLQRDGRGARLKPGTLSAFSVSFYSASSTVTISVLSGSGWNRSKSGWN